MMLYSGSGVRIRVNGQLLDAFSESNGMRKGCPLSPLLYVISLEPMLNCLRTNASIRGVMVRGRECKLVAFADDVLFFLTDPITMLSNLLRALDSFLGISEMKVNYVKLYALNVSFPSYHP